jgi:hypothetical protein
MPGYTLTPTALERWRDKGLTLELAADGGIKASFRFEGSTCGGVPLTMIYCVSLSPEADGRRIRALDCAPAPGTDGHESMCSFYHTNGRILEFASAEKPLLGEPLDAVLTWRPKIVSAGCLCAPQSRTHKWTAVFQTIHFALNPPAPVAEATGV